MKLQKQFFSKAKVRKLTLQYVKTLAHLDKCYLTELSSVCDKKCVYVFVLYCMCVCGQHIVASNCYSRKKKKHTTLCNSAKTNSKTKQH